MALLTIETFPFTLPAAVGPNCTDKLAVCNGARVTGALPPVIV